MTGEPSPRTEIDRLLGQALAAWENLPDVQREIESWDLIDQLVFVEERPIEEDRPRALADHATRGDLTEQQRASVRRAPACCRSASAE